MADCPSPDSLPADIVAPPGQGVICTETALVLNDMNVNEMLKDTDVAKQFDEMCDPDNPRMSTFQEISAAAYKIKNGVLRTPCTRSGLSRMYGMDIWFKKEFEQFTGSFKERGARNVLLNLPLHKRAVGVIAASAGNHALAMSYHGQLLNTNVTVVMPKIAPIMKVQNCKVFGANVIVAGEDLGESKRIALILSKKFGMVYVNGYDHPDILAGQGTAGLEIVEQVDDIDAVVIPVGGGGLIAGAALAIKSLKPSIQIIGVEPERCHGFADAMEAGKPISSEVKHTLADGLAVPVVGVNAFATARNLIDKMVTVSEQAIALAILRLVEQEKAVVEGAGAAGVAAIVENSLEELKGKRVVVILCGGNIDTSILGRCLERGLAADGRLVAFKVLVPDSCSAIAQLSKLIGDMGVSIKDIIHERAWVKSDVFKVAVKVVCETRDKAQALDLEKKLRDTYEMLSWNLPAV
ncbi:L-threonine ammonia-lyase-like isoform X2 [Watersipora subatra]